MSMLQELRRFNVDTAELDEIVGLVHYAKGLQAEYATLGLPTPEWIDDKTRTLVRAIRLKTEEQRALRLKEIAAEEARLATPAEKRAALAAEKEKLLATP